MEMHEVYSSAVQEIGYEDGRLVVVWKERKGRPPKTSTYTGVPPDLAQQVMNAPSIGQALRESVQGVYDHGYGEADEA
jgi:hypothetical protein